MKADTAKQQRALPEGKIIAEPQLTVGDNMDNAQIPMAPYQKPEDVPGIENHAAGRKLSAGLMTKVKTRDFR